MSATECRVCGHRSPIGHDCKSVFDELKAENARLREVLNTARKLAAEQAEDQGLWSFPVDRMQTVAESALKHALRELHYSVEEKE